MPEIAEVARIVHYLRKSLVGKTLAVVKAQDDTSVFGKVGTSGAEFQESLMGKRVLDAGQQGKYFWLIMSSPPHPVLHFGMTGWIQIRGEPTSHYRPKDLESSSEWPPKHWKFTMVTDEEPKVEVAFTDARRFGRIRLVHCAAEDIRNTTPLKENGPDPVIDKHLITEEWLDKKMNSKHVPVKALLLDQANISGIGNYVGDEILYHAKLHPEQYSDTFSSAQLKQLRASILHICQTVVDALGDSSKFPDDWLFHYRWGKGKKDAPTTLPNGAKTTFITVGGRTSCVVPSVQKKTGAVAGDVKKENLDEGKKGGSSGKKTDISTGKERASKKRKAATDENAKQATSKAVNGRSRSKKSAVLDPEELEEEPEFKDDDLQYMPRKRRVSSQPTSQQASLKVNGTKRTKRADEVTVEARNSGGRRSGGVSRK